MKSYDYNVLLNVVMDMVVPIELLTALIITA